MSAEAFKRAMYMQKRREYERATEDIYQKWVNSWQLIA